MRRVLLAVLIVLGVTFAPGAARSAGPTNVSGTISTNTTWTLANSPYVMTGDVTVASGVTLTIEAGVMVEGDSTFRQLTVNGSLSAVGSAPQHITFTSTSDSGPGQWNQLSFGSGSGSSTLDYVDVRYGGDSGLSTQNGMVSVGGGTLTIDHSTFTHSAVSGLIVSGDSSGAGISVTIRHSKFESNGFVGGSRHGDGLYFLNAPVTVEDSAFWSNANDGIDAVVGNTYSQTPGTITGSSMWGNNRYGVYLGQGTGASALAPDGHVAGKPGNAIYDNGTFGFSQNELWNQLYAALGSNAVDWSGNYWGPVVFRACPFDSQRGELSYEGPVVNPAALLSVPRGAISHSETGTLSNWCANDDVVGNAPSYLMPNLYFNAPPPVFGGLLSDQSWACTACALREPENAMAYDHPGSNPFRFTSGPVNTATGALTESATDVRLAGAGIPFGWARYYTSADTTSGPLGVGWTEPFAAKITVVDQSTGELLYRAGPGQQTHFTRVTGGSSGSAAYYGKGFDGTFQRLSDNSYQLTTRDQRVFSFDSSGNLTQIKPRFLPATSLSYSSGKLASITDSAGRTITLTYSVSNPALIEKVTLPDGRYVQYGYTNSHLTSVQDARGKIWTLAYDANGRLTSIQDPVAHYQLQNVLYDAQGRVTSEQNGTGDTLSYAYTTSSPYAVTTVTVPGRGNWVYKHVGNMLFNVTDPLGRTTSYTYDSMGRTATVTDGRGNSRRFEYNIGGDVVKEVAPDPLGYTISRTFNSTNDPLSETDGRGNATTYTYANSDPAADYQDGQLKTITDREGGVTTFKYWTSSSSPAPPATNVGLLKNVTNQRSKTTNYDYDSSGNLTKLTSPLGLKTTMTYDSSGRLLSRRDPRGNVPNPPAGYLTQWTYDEVDHVKTLTDARGNVTTFDYLDNELPWKITRTENDSTARVTSFDYDNANRLWKTTDPRGGIETRLYWPDGQLKSVQSPAGRTTSYSYDNAGQVTSLVEPNGNAAGATPSDWTWTYGYDNAGNRTSEAHPDGGTTQIAYDALNRPNQWTDPLTHVTSVAYDANSNVTTSTDGLNHSKTYTYDKLDRLKTLTDERSKIWTYAYFATGELQSITSPLGNKITYSLDDDGRTSSMVEPRGNVVGADPTQFTWAYQYDEAGNRTRVTDPLGDYVQYAYDAANNLTQVTDQRGNATGFTYDTMNRLWKVTPPAAGGTGTLDTVYAYDAAGNLASRTDPNGHATSWGYDLDGLVTQRTTPVGTWNLTYDSNGNLKTLQAPSTGVVSDSYDRMSRLVGTSFSDTTPAVTRTYDLTGRASTMSDGSGSVGYTFDNANRLTDISRTGGGAGLNGTLHYDYDNAGNVTGRSYPDTTALTQAFDDDGRLTSVVSGGQTTSFAYDAAGNLTTSTLPSGNGYAETRSYDRAGRLTTVDNAKAGVSLSKFQWTLDAAGNPTKAQTTRAGGDTYDAYEYDARNRLTAACYAVAQSATNCTGAANEISYAYDKVSNRTQEVRTGSVGNTGTISYAYNSADQLTSSTNGGSTTNYSYDANGNETGAGSRTFSYNLANELVSTTGGGTTTTYAYDGAGRRVSATTSGGADTRFIWDPLAASGIPELALEQTSTGGLVRRYLNGPNGAVSLTNATGTFYYHRDPIGSITDVTDASGVAQWKYEYEAYGAERSATNVSGSAPTNRLRFNGQYLDSEDSSYQLRAREYDPSTGRFNSPDPLEPSAAAPFDGAYAYVDGRPTTLVDPLGLCGWSDPWNCAADAAAGTAGVVTGAATGLAQDAGTAYSQRGGGLDGTLAAIDALNPVSRARRAAQQGYTDAGGGVGGVLGAMNALNPMYYFLLDGDQCIHAAGARAVGHDCFKAALDAASAAGGASTASALGRCIGDGDSLLRRLVIDERGEIGTPSRRGKIRQAGLPANGPIRYVPPRGWHPSEPLRRGPSNGYVDRFGNEWVRGRSSTPGEPFEWDVQLSPTGRAQLGHFSRDGIHVNVSMTGVVTH